MYLIKEDDRVITKVSYKLRRTLPGQSYDYEELYAEDCLSETEDPKSPVQMMKDCIELCISNTARARAAKNGD